MLLSSTSFSSLLHSSSLYYFAKYLHFFGFCGNIILILCFDLSSSHKLLQLSPSDLSPASLHRPFIVTILTMCYSLAATGCSIALRLVWPVIRFGSDWPLFTAKLFALHWFIHRKSCLSLIFLACALLLVVCVEKLRSCVNWFCGAAVTMLAVLS